MIKRKMSDLLYDALMMGRNKEVAKEEYLVATGAKEPARFKAEENNIYLSDINSDTTGVIHLVLETPGYLEIECYCKDSFIAYPKKVITSDEFEDGAYTFTFTIRAAALHGGKNFARIIFRNPKLCCNVDIVVDNQVRFAFAQNDRRKIRMQMCRDYLDLRMGKLYEEDWQIKTEKLLGSLNETDTEELFMMLYRANVLISEEKYVEAKNLIEFVAEQSGKLPDKNWDLISYFMYISRMYEMDEESSAAAAEQVRKIYDEHPSWIVLWTLIYTDKALSENPEKTLELLKGEYIMGKCISPVMYFEAAERFKEDPKLLKDLSQFEIQTVYFAAKNDFLNINLALKFADMICDTPRELLPEHGLKLIEKILKISYEKFESNVALKSLCKVLVAEDNRDCENHKYFVKAIKDYLDTEKTYHYFIYTAPRDEYVDIPKVVMEYFVDYDKELGIERAYFYDCVIEGRKKWMNYYLRFLNPMTGFTAQTSQAGAINESLAYVYGHLLDEKRLATAAFGPMLEVLCTKELTVKSDRIVSVLVFHRELNNYQESYVENGKALVKIFNNDAVILFKDPTGNFYADIETEERVYMEKAKYIDQCVKNTQINKYMLIGDQLALLKAVREPVDILEYLFRQMGSGELRPEYEQEILRDMIMYFSRSNKDIGVAEKLIHFLKFDLDIQVRGKLIEVLIDRRMFREAVTQIERFGYSTVDIEHLCELCHVSAELTDYDDDRLMREMCRDCFMKGDFDKVIFEYLKRNYDGETEVLLKMYTAAKAYSLEDPIINERLIRRMLDQGIMMEEGEDVFTSYFKDGDDEKLKCDFIVSALDKYLYEGNDGVTYAFAGAESKLNDGEKFPERTCVAFLLYMKDKRDIDVRTLRTIESLVGSLTRKSIMLEEFKEYGKMFQLPKNLSNTYIAQVLRPNVVESDGDEISRRDLFPGAPKIEYEIIHRDGVTQGKEAMREIFDGCYTRNFTLFFGESLRYSIDDGVKVTVGYNDLKVERDGSRFADIDNLIQLSGGEDYKQLERAAVEYYLKNELIDNLF